MITRDAGLLVILVALLPAIWFEMSWRELADAPQTIYQTDVPHTASDGAPLAEYLPGRSFFPVGIYHALTGEWHGRHYSLKNVVEAGFNTVHFWERISLPDVVEAAAHAGVQVVFHDPDVDQARTFRNHPALLSWYLDEEPGLRFPESAQARLRQDFAARRAALRAVDPDRPVHIVAAPPGRFAVWDAWSTVGDVAAFVQYPVTSGRAMQLVGPRALADNVARAVALNGGKKPVWYIAQAFASPVLGWRMPTPGEYRTTVYAAIVHGATGVIAFAYDSFVTRDGQVLGIAPDPLADYGETPDYDTRGDRPFVADAAALAASRELWHGVAHVNRELATLTPALLSPTATLRYRIAVRGLSDLTTPVRALLKRDSDGYVLIVVNLAANALDMRITVDDGVAGVRRPFDPAAAFVATAEGWQSRIAAFETQIYRFTVTVHDPTEPEPQS